MRKILTQKFFNRSTLKVAEELLGKYLVRNYRERQIALMITEVEAYDGFKDKASQAHRGKTERNKIMFGEAGTIYVYFTYGMHWMLNIVTGKKDYPAAVLIRGGIEVSGPARLTKFLKVDKRLNNKKLGKKTGLWIEDRGDIVKKWKVESGKLSQRSNVKSHPGSRAKLTTGQGKWNIIRTPRIGIPRAEEWVEKPYRFVLKEE